MKACTTNNAITSLFRKKYLTLYWCCHFLLTLFSAYLSINVPFISHHQWPIWLPCIPYILPFRFVFVLFCFASLRRWTYVFMIYKAVKHSIVKDWTLHSSIWIKYVDGANHRQISAVHIENTNQSIFSGRNQINMYIHDIYEADKLIVSHKMIWYISALPSQRAYTIEWNSNYSDKHIKFSVKHVY